MKVIWKVHWLIKVSKRRVRLQPLLHDTALTQHTYWDFFSNTTHPELVRWQGQRFTVRLLVYFSKMVTKKNPNKTMKSHDIQNANLEISWGTRIVTFLLRQTQ